MRGMAGQGEARLGEARVYFQFHFKEILKHDYSDRHEED